MLKIKCAVRILQQDSCERDKTFQEKQVYFITTERVQKLFRGYDRSCKLLVNTDITFRKVSTHFLYVCWSFFLILIY